MNYGHIDDVAARQQACVAACEGIPTYQLFGENDAPNLLGEVIDSLRVKLAAAEALSVRKILIEVVPGSDGMGLEVYAESLDQVVSLLTELSDRAENAEARIKSMGEQKPCAAIGWCYLYGATCECGVDGPCERTVNVYLAAGAKHE